MENGEQEHGVWVRDETKMKWQFGELEKAFGPWEMK